MEPHESLVYVTHRFTNLHVPNTRHEWDSIISSAKQVAQSFQSDELFATLVMLSKLGFPIWNMRGIVVRCLTKAECAKYLLSCTLRPSVTNLKRIEWMIMCVNSSAVLEMISMGAKHGMLVSKESVVLSVARLNMQLFCKLKEFATIQVEEWDLFRHACKGLSADVEMQAMLMELLNVIELGTCKNPKLLLHQVAFTWFVPVFKRLVTLGAPIDDEFVKHMFTLPRSQILYFNRLYESIQFVESQNATLIPKYLNQLQNTDMFSNFAAQSLRNSSGDEVLILLQYMQEKYQHCIGNPYVMLHKLEQYNDNPYIEKIYQFIFQTCTGSMNEEQVCLLLGCKSTSGMQQMLQYTGMTLMQVLQPSTVKMFIQLVNDNQFNSSGWNNNSTWYNMHTFLSKLLSIDYKCRTCFVVSDISKDQRRQVHLIHMGLVPTAEELLSICRYFANDGPTLCGLQRCGYAVRQHVPNCVSFKGINRIPMYHCDKCSRCFYMPKHLQQHSSAHTC